jgi:ABC-2 type transport system permease protein
MIDLIAAEFLKLRTTRTFWMLALFSLGIVALSSVATLATDMPATEEDARSLLFSMNAGGLLMLVLGVVSSAGEYRHGTIVTTFLVAPDRRRVVGAKFLAIGLMGVGVAIASALLMLAITLPWLFLDGESLGSLGISGADLAGIFGQATAFTAISAMLGMGIGALLTNQIAAIVVVPVLVFVVDPLISLLIGGYDTYSIGGLWTALGGENSEDAGYRLLAPTPAALLYFAYAAAITAVTAVISQRRDVS